MPTSVFYTSSANVSAYPIIQADVRVTAQTGAVSPIATYTVGAADGTFWLSGNVLCTAFTSGSFSIAFSYTDEGGTARTSQAFQGHFTSGYGTTITGTGAFEVEPVQIRAKAATAISILTTGTFTNLTYNAEGTITQVA